MISTGPMKAAEKPTQNNTRRPCSTCFCDLLQWKHPRITASSLIIINGAFLVFHIFRLSLLNVLCLLVLAVLMLGFAISITFDISDYGFTPVEFISQKTVDEYMVTVYNSINGAMNYVYRLIIWRNRSHSIRACICLALVAYISFYFQICTIFLATLNLCFLWKHIEELYLLIFKEYVDQLRNSAATSLSALSCKESHQKTN